MPSVRPLTPAAVPLDLGARAFEHAATLCALGPRHTGSMGWTEGVSYITETLRELGLEPERDRWTDAVEGLAFSNVSVTLPGLQQDKIVLACHHDTKCTSGHDDPEHNFEFVGANDSASGVGLLLALAEVLRDAPRLVTFEFVFFDGEESVPYVWDDGRALFGSRRYVRRYEQTRFDDPTSPRILGMVLVDMVGAIDLQIDRERSSTPDLVAIVEHAARACGHSERFFEHEIEVTDDHTPFLRAGIPAVDLIDIVDNPQWHTPKDTIDTLSPESLQIVGHVVLTALPEIARWAIERDLAARSSWSR